MHWNIPQRHTPLGVLSVLDADVEMNGLGKHDEEVIDIPPGVNLKVTPESKKPSASSGLDD